MFDKIPHASISRKMVIQMLQQVAAAARGHRVPRREGKGRQLRLLENSSTSQVHGTAYNTPQRPWC